jgi:hypothetical protein
VISVHTGEPDEVAHMITGFLEYLVGLVSDHVQFLAGLLSGLLLALIRWWVSRVLLGPKVTFSPKISKLSEVVSDEDKSKGRYRIKLRNDRRFRQLIDVKLVARLSILGLRPEPKFQNRWTAVDIPIGEANGTIPRLRKKWDVEDGLYIFGLNVNRIESLHGFWPPEIRQKKNDGTLTLEDLMDAGQGGKAKLRIFVSGYDQLSGTRKMFESKPYIRKHPVEDDCIQNGDFVEDSLEIAPQSKGASPGSGHLDAVSPSGRAGMP